MVGKNDRPADEKMELPGLDKAFRTEPPELTFPATLASSWPTPGVPVRSGFQAPVKPSAAFGAPAAAPPPASLGCRELQHVQALDSVIISFNKRCQSAWRSMRPWESTPEPIRFLARPDSQDRMDLMVRVAGWSKELVDRWVGGLLGAKAAALQARP